MNRANPATRHAPAAHALFSLRTLCITLGLTAVAVIGRMMPHEPNVAPIAACALFGGFLLRGSALAAAPVLLGMYLTDLFIGGYDARIMAVVYGALCMPMLAGRFLSRQPGIATIGLAAVGGSVLFFASSNFAVWIFSGLYPQTAAGLSECFSAALPFFRYTLIGDLSWNAALFGGYALVMLLTRAQRQAAIGCAAA